MARISIIIPVYNCEKHISRCIDSIISQTNKDYDIIVINDGSTDNSLAILNAYKNKFPTKITLIDQENCGVANTRNKGIELAAGEFITFIDNDDYLDDDYLDTLVKGMEDGEYDILISGYRRITETGKVLFSRNIQDKVFQKYIIVAPWARLFRREFLIKENIGFYQYGIGEDVYFNIHAYQKTDKIKMIDYVGYNWFFNSASVSNTSQRGFNKEVDVLYLLDKIKSVVQKEDFTIQYFYVRYVVWYLLFSGRQTKSSEFNKECRRLFAWLKGNYIKLGCKLFSKKIAGEGMNRLIVWCFYIMYKMKFISVFSKIYCNGGTPISTTQCEEESQ